MSTSLTYPVRAKKREVVVEVGTITIGTDGNPSAVSGIVSACANPSSGNYAVTLARKFPGGSLNSIEIRGATPIVALPWIKAIDLAAGTLTFFPMNASAAAATMNQIVVVEITILALNQAN